MNWTEPKPPTRDVSFYDHIICKTPLGKFMIEWKSWKESPRYDIMLAGNWIAVEYDLDTAKTVAKEYILNKQRELSDFLGF
jgi:hypothetical protein